MNKQKKIHKKDKKDKKQQCLQQQITKTVHLTFDDYEQTYENLDITECINAETQQLNIKKLIKLFQKLYNLSFMNKQIKYYYQEGRTWLLCPKLNTSISYSDYYANDQIKLSVKICKEYIEAIMEQSDENSQSQNISEEQLENDLKCRRLKERKIKHVIEKVLKWRSLYAGIDCQQKVPLEQGAKLVNISKKTLDDYLSQIKKGKKYGFNFNEHKNEKVGILREFIRKAQKSKEK